MTRKLLFFGLAVLPLAVNAQTAVWGVGSGIGETDAQFQNGFTNATTASYGPTEWTAQTVSESGGGIIPGAAYWVRSSNGSTQGAYAPGMPLIASPTAANGVALFDSDFMDNNGVAGAFGTGTSPSPHTGDLISPRIDLSGYSNTPLNVKFYCQYRPFQINELWVSLSTDDGVTWTNVDIATLLPTSTNNMIQGWVNASFPSATQGVANLTNCRLRFHFSGDYYCALMDDLTIETVCAPTTSNLTVSTCEDYTSPSGNYVWNTSGTYNDTLVNAGGCDSVLTIDLTIESVSDLTTSLSGVTITANNGNATYQWLDCNNNYAPISGATNSMFTPSANGSYAVELMENGCVDTSACVMVSTVGLAVDDLNGNFTLSPNPTEGQFTVTLGSVQAHVSLSITDESGRLIQSKEAENVDSLNVEIDGAPGVYFVTIESGDQHNVIRLIKE